MNLKLIDDWKQAWKFWSVRIWFLLGLLPQALPMLDPALTAQLPLWARNGISLAAFIGIVARLLKQPTLRPSQEDGAT